MAIGSLKQYHDTESDGSPSSKVEWWPNWSEKGHATAILIFIRGSMINSLHSLLWIGVLHLVLQLKSVWLSFGWTLTTDCWLRYHGTHFSVLSPPLGLGGIIQLQFAMGLFPSFCALAQITLAERWWNVDDRLVGGSGFDITAHSAEPGGRPNPQ